MAASSTNAAHESLGLLKEIKNLEEYLGELKHRSEKRLKELKYERKLMHEQKVNVIAELQKEIHLLKESNRTLKLELEHQKAENENSKEIASLKEQIKTLEKGKGWLEQIAARKDGIIEELQNQIDSSQQPREASPSRGARENERLALVLKDREHELVEVRRESNNLKAIVEDLHAKHRSQQQDLEDACHEAESLRGILSELDAQNNDQELMEANQEIDSLKCLTQELREALDEKMEDSDELEKVQEECQHLRSLVAEMKSQDSTREFNAIKQEAESLRSTVAELRDQNAKQSTNAKHMEQALAKLKTDNEGLVKWIEDLNASTRKSIADVGRMESCKSDKIPSRPASIRDVPTLADPDVSQQLHMAYEEISALYDIRDDIMAEVQAMRREIFNPQAMRKMVKIVRDKELASLQKVVSDLQSRLDEKTCIVAQITEDMQALEERCSHEMKIMELETQGQVKHIKEKWRSEFERRKKLHNALLELKGNIRVFCRIRPMLEAEMAMGGVPAVQAKDEENLAIASPEGSKDSSKIYEFDRVFGPGDGQEVVFEEVSSLVTSVLDGYNVCIMAYGQTGSGKTFTMDGPEHQPGVNSRTLSQLFRIADSRNGQNNYTIKASVLEIYNEQIVDLLSDSRDKKLDIKQDADGMYVPGLQIEEVRSMEDVKALIATGKKNRSTFATNMNEHSSRSHLVFSVYVENQSNTQANGRRLKGKLHLIDLAGSERLSKTGAQGDRLREAQNINKSLSALGDVIQALRQKSQHIPFRNSKLTRFLEDSLGRSSKCLLMANFSPSVANCAESRCSAEFASRAKKVELGKTVSSIIPQNRRRPPMEQK